jgi:ankyrin repeat protein
VKVRIVIAVVVLLFIGSLYPAMKRTYAWAGDAHGLILLAAANRGEFVLNPYSPRGILVTPNMAIWILGNLEYPYSNCLDAARPIDVCEVPLIMWAGRELGMSNSMVNDRMYRILQILIAREEPVNQLHEGFTAIHEAILFNDAAYLEMLLNAGADPGMRIQHPGKEYDGYDAMQFYQLIKSKKGDSMNNIGDILDRYHAPPSS